MIHTHAHLHCLASFYPSISSRKSGPNNTHNAHFPLAHQRPTINIIIMISVKYIKKRKIFDILRWVNKEKNDDEPPLIGNC